MSLSLHCVGKAAENLLGAEWNCDTRRCRLVSLPLFCIQL